MLLSPPRPVRIMLAVSRRLLILASCVGLWSGPGCQQPVAPTAPTATDLEQVQFEGLWQTSLEVLRRCDFRPDRQDRRAGVITTEPTTSAQWFEVWRPEVTGAYQEAEANLHTVRRQATVQIKQDPEQPGCHVSVQVDVYRYSAPERQVTTASGALQIFGEKLPTAEGQLGPQEAKAGWVYLGRDGRLEAELLRRIIWHYRPALAEAATYEAPTTQPAQTPQAQ